MRDFSKQREIKKKLLDAGDSLGNLNKSVSFAKNSVISFAKSVMDLKRGLQSSSDYGPIQKGRVYQMVDEGIDWYKVKCQGKLIVVPKHVF